MPEGSTFRLYRLSALYLLIAVGLAVPNTTPDGDRENR